MAYSAREHLLAYARSEKLARVVGLVMAENTEMLAMVRDLGYSVAPEPGEPGLRRVEISLPGR